MIAEKHFTLSHSAFWHQLLPLSENYVRECNVEAGRFVDELETEPVVARPFCAGHVAYDLNRLIRNFDRLVDDRA